MSTQPIRADVCEEMSPPARRSPFTHVHDQPGWTELCQLGKSQICSAGFEIFRQGDASSHVFAVAHGLIKLVYVRNDGRTAILGLRSLGWILGSAAVMMGESYLSGAIAVTPCELRRIPSGVFRQAIAESPRASSLLHLMHAREVINQLNQVANLNCFSGRERLGRFLAALRSELAEGSDGPWTVPLKDLEIAQMIGVTPQWFCGLAHELASEGFMSRKGHRWVLRRRVTVAGGSTS